MTTPYTFVNPVAARLFAEWWNAGNPEAQVSALDADVTYHRLGQTLDHYLGNRFKFAAEAFNAASQKAREIGEGDDENETK